MARRGHQCFVGPGGPSGQGGVQERFGKISPTTLWGPRPDPWALSPLLSHLNLQRGDGGHRPSMVCWARRPLRTRGTIGNVPGRSPDHPVGPRPDLRALSRLVPLFEQRPSLVWCARRRLRTWETVGKVRGRSPDHPVGPKTRPPRALFRLVTLFEPGTLGRLQEAINITA